MLEQDSHKKRLYLREPSKVININDMMKEVQARQPNTIILPKNRETEPLREPAKKSVYEEILAQYEKISKVSKYPCSFDYTVYQKLEERFKDNPPRGGIVFKGPVKLINHHYSCQECLYAFMVDTYGRGCIHNCAYCYARSELIVHGYWNKPFPMPVNINDIWKIFYTVFETDKKSKWRQIIEKRIPIRIGYASDSFMWMDLKYKITQELIKLLNYYKYPYIVATRSDLVAHDTYIELMDKELCSVQMSIISTNEEVNKKIEPGAPSAKRRLLALQKLGQAGFWTTVRLNPLFPIYPDGYFTDPNFPAHKKNLKLDVFSFDMIKEIADYNVPSLLTGFGRFSSYAINQMDKALGTDMRQFYDGKKFEGTRDFHYSDQEIRHYYERVKNLCRENNIQFTTCYIGNGEPHFWKDQDLWDNKHDCCNAKGRIDSFKNDSHIVPYGDRLKFSTSTCGKQPAPQRELIKISEYIKNTESNPFIKGNQEDERKEDLHRD